MASDQIRVYNKYPDREKLAGSGYSSSISFGPELTNNVDKIQPRWRGASVKEVPRSRSRSTISALKIRECTRYKV